MSGDIGKVCCANVCQNWKWHLKDGQPKVCLREADDRYTMDFTDVESGSFIYWCSSCGPLETAIGEAFARFVACSPANAERATRAIADAVKKVAS